MVNIKTYKDGDRFILVVENCIGETAQKVNSFVADLLGLSEAVKPVQVPLKPIKVKEETPPVLPSEEIKEASFTEEAPRPQEEMVSFKDSATITRDEVLEFVKMTENQIKEPLQAILDMAGYADIHDFIAFADEKSIKDAYEVLINAF